MSPEEIRAAVEEENPKARFFEEFDAALLGPLRRCGQPTIAAYSYQRAVDVLMQQEGMTHEEAVEWMEYNVIGLWIGEHTPAWLCDHDQA